MATITIKATYDNSLACAGLAITFPTPKSKSVVAATTAIETRARLGLNCGARRGGPHSAVAAEECERRRDTHAACLHVHARAARAEPKERVRRPVSLSFTVPSLNASRLKVRYLTIDGKAEPSRAERSRRKAGGGAHSGPHRWVRYVTKSNNFVARV